MVHERLATWGYVLGWKVVCRIPERWAAWAFRQAADWLWRREGSGVRQLEANLARVSRAATGPGSAGPATDDLRELSRRGMRSYLRYWLEVFRLPVTPGEEILDRMRCTGEEAAFQHLAARRGVIFALPHMGNWDHAGAWIVLRGVGTFTTVAERLHPRSLYDKFVAFRESLGMEVLPHTGGTISRFGVLARRLHAGGLVCLLCERDLTGTGVEVEFFGEPARMMGGPAALAVETGAALMPVTLWYSGRYWCARIHPEIAVPDAGHVDEQVAVMTQEVARVFEAAIAQHPEDWHMLQKVFVADLGPGHFSWLPRDAGVDGDGSGGEGTSGTAAGADLGQRAED